MITGRIGPRLVLLHVLFAAAYAASLVAGAAFAVLPPGNIPLVGFASGIAAVGMLALGRGFALTLLPFAVGAHALLLGPVSAFSSSVAVAVCAVLDVLQAAAIRMFFRRNLDPERPLATRAGVTRFALFVVLIPVLLADWLRMVGLEVLGVLSLGPARFLYQYFKMVSADVFGLLLAVPLFVSLVESTRIPRALELDIPRLLRGLFRMALLLEFGYLAFMWHEAILFFTMPILIWITVADRLPGLMTGMLLLSLGGVAGTALGFGPFHADGQNGIVRLVAFLSCWNLPFLFTHGLMEELHAARERLSDQVLERTTELRRALEELAMKHEELSDRNLELQRAEADLVVAKERAEAASRAKSMHLSRMSHELRTPLNAIAGFCGLIGLKGGSGGLSEETRRYFEHIETASTRLTELIGNILDLAKIEEGRIEVTRDEVDVPALARNILAINQSAATIKGIRLSADLAENLSGGVVTDGDKVHKIVMNLVSNAVKFTPPGGSVTMRAGLVGTDLVVVVADTGPGIPANRLESVFEPFVQADATVSRHFGGTGLGLAIARQMAQVLGGEIAVESAAGKGSTFTVRLPVVRVASPVSRESPRGTDDPARRQVTGSSIVTASGDRDGGGGKDGAQPSPRALQGTYLVVDDESVNRKVMTDWLELGQTLVDVAADGESALKRLDGLLAAGRPPTAVLLDLHLPGIDGIEVAARIQSDPRTFSIPILIITADVTSETQARCRAAGVHEVLTKPVDFDILARRLLALEAGIGR